MATESIIYFKSLSGDILTLSFTSEKSIEQFRDEIAQQISLEQGDEIGSERIIIFHQNQDDDDKNDSSIPVLQQDQTYSYFIREDHQIHYSISLDSGSPARVETKQTIEYEEDDDANLYHRYDIKIFEGHHLSSQQHQLIQEFSFYYNPYLRLFFHQDYIQIIRPGATRYHTETIQLLGHPQEIGMPLFALAYQYLDIPWFNRNIVAQLIQIKWRELEEPYLDDVHFQDFPDPYHPDLERQEPPFDDWREQALDPHNW
jgi:hypothetical protein